MEWQREDRFVVYPTRTPPDVAIWNLDIQLDLPRTFYASARRFDPQLAQKDLAALEAYARYLCTAPPGSKHKVLELTLRQTEFKGQPAIYTYTKSYEAERGFYTLTESYLFADPSTPKKLFDVSWSERYSKNQDSNPLLAEKGRLFFQRFKLLPPEAEL